MQKTKKITVIIPCLPKQNSGTAVSSLKDIDYPKNKIEILIAEGNNPSRQRNLAIDQATGEILFFFDDDAEIPRDYLKKAMHHYENEGVDALGGPVETSKESPFLQKCFGYVIGSYFATQSMSNKFKGHGKTRTATEKELILCNFSMRRKSLGDKRFDERLYPNEENELYNRLISEGKNLVYNPSLKVYRKQRDSIHKFAKQFFKYGYSRVEHLLIRPSSISPVFLVPPIFVIYLLTIIGLSITNQITLPLIAPIVLYISISLVIAGIIATNQKDPKSLLVTPFLFFIVHTTYGLGMMVSLLNFRKKIRPKEVKIRKIHLK